MQDGKDNEAGWVFKPDDVTSQPEAAAAPQDQPVQSDLGSQGVNQSSDSGSEAPQTPSGYPLIEWTASEYIAHQKTYGWYLMLGLASAGIAAAVYLVTGGDIVSAVVVVLLGLSLGIFGARQPRELNYAIDSNGLQVGEKFYPYSTFKTFSVARDQAIGYISLSPLRRFMPPLTIHYDPADETKIAEALAQYLPHDTYKPDITDIISRKIRF